MLYEPGLVFLCSYRALDPAWSNVIDSDALLPATPTNGFHKPTKSILGGSVFPISLVKLDSQFQINRRFVILQGNRYTQPCSQ